MKTVTITITIGEQTVERDYKVYEVSDQDWNPVVNDMADSIEDAARD